MNLNGFLLLNFTECDIEKHELAVMFTNEMGLKGCTTRLNIDTICITLISEMRGLTFALIFECDTLNLRFNA